MSDFKSPTDAGNPHRDHAAMVRRLVSAWSEASADDLAAGIAWYGRAESAAAAMAGDAVSARTAAAILAALSPRNRWNVNLAQTAKVIDAVAAGRPCPAVSTGDNRAKAWRLANGADPDAPGAFGVDAPKVRRFFANITGDHDAVTVDVWAARAAEGCSIKAGPKGPRYDAIERAYQDAARVVGVTPRELQAAVWVHVRGAAD